jgi:hypothetical protein
MDNRNCNLDSLIRESEHMRQPNQLDDDMSDALRDAVISTRAKIDDAFSRGVKFSARLKTVAN